MNRNIRILDIVIASFGVIGTIVGLLGANYELISIRIAKIYSLIKSLNLPEINGYSFIYFEKENLAIYLIFYIFVIVITSIELKKLIIPDKYTLPGILVGITLSFLFSRDHFFSHLIGVFVVSIPFFLVAWFYTLLTGKEGLGGGVIKLSAMIGAFVGAQNAIISALIAIIFGNIYIFGIIIFKRKKNITIEFGPFLSLSALISTLTPIRFLIFS